MEFEVFDEAAHTRKVERELAASKIAALARGKSQRLKRERELQDPEPAIPELAFEHAVLNNKPERMIELMEEMQQHPDEFRDEDGHSMLWVSCSKGLTKAAAALIDMGSNLDDCECTKWGGEMSVTPLIIASRNGHADCVDYLITGGADVTQHTHKDHATPLHEAATNGHVDCLDLLLAVDGVEVDKPTRAGRTALLLAVRNGQPECTDLLLTAGASPATKEKSGASVYDAAIAACEQAMAGEEQEKLVAHCQQCVELIEQALGPEAVKQEKAKHVKGEDLW